MNFFVEFLRSSIVVIFLTQLIFHSYISIEERFSYFGGYFVPRNLEVFEVIFYTLLLILFWMVSKSLLISFKGFTRAICYWIFFMIVIPITVVSFISENPIYYSLGPLIYFTSIIMGLYIPFFINLNFNRKIYFNESFFILGALFLSLILILLTVYFFNIGSLRYVLSNIYLQRMTMRETMPFPGSGYLFYATGRFAAPFLIAYGYIYNKKLAIAIGIFAGIYCFLVGGHKMMFGVSFFAIYLAFMLKRYNVEKTIKITLYIFFSVWAVLEILNFNLLVDILYRRMIILPGVLYTFYTDLFFLDPNILRDTPMDVGRIPFIVSETYFNRPDMRSNAGVLTASVIRFGFFGFLTGGLILGLLLRVLQDLLNSLSSKLKITLLIFFLSYSISLMDSALGVILITQGLILVFLVRFSLGMIKWRF